MAESGRVERLVPPEERDDGGDLHAAGARGDGVEARSQDIPEQFDAERGRHEDVQRDPAGRPTPYVAGPMGAAPLATELRGDPEEDRGGDTGAVGGAIAGTSLAGPLGGMAGAVAGGVAGAELEDDDDGAPGDDGPGGREPDRR